MKLLEVNLPKSVVIGKEALEKTGDVCRNLDLKSNVTVFVDPNVMETAGNKVVDTLEGCGYKVSLVYLPKKIGVKDLAGINSDFIVGVGGGRTIDVAKMAAKVNCKPFISVPTAMSHDGISSNRAVLDVYSVPAVMPDAIIIDTGVIAKSPYRLTASGCGDVIAKLTAVEDWKLSHEQTGEYISEYAAAINKTSAELILKSAESIRRLETRGLRNLIEALVFSGVSMSIAGSSRPSSGSEHLFSHALKVIYPNKTSLHGEECGVGAILCSYLHGMDWQTIASSLKVIGAPTNSKELKVPKETIVKALVKARNLRKDRYTILNYKKIDYKTAKKASKETGVV